MNITLDLPINQFWLTAERGAAPYWTPLAKDGFDLPPTQRTPRRARQTVSIGETYDFSLTFPEPGEYVMEGRFGSGTIYAKQKIHVLK